MPVNKLCEVCGRAFCVPPSRANQRTCSYECRSEIMPERTKTHNERIAHALKRGALFDCQVCGQSFWRRPHAIKRGQNKFCSRRCCSAWMRGRPTYSGVVLYGPQNPNWRGGVTARNALIRKNREFRQWRAAVFARDDWTCQRCGARAQAGLCVRIAPHHIKPFATFPKLRFELDNGVTLCNTCHHFVHSKANTTNAFLKGGDVDA